MSKSSSSSEAKHPGPEEVSRRTIPKKPSTGATLREAGGLRQHRSLPVCRRHCQDQIVVLALCRIRCPVGEARGLGVGLLV